MRGNVGGAAGHQRRVHRAQAREAIDIADVVHDVLKNQIENIDVLACVGKRVLVLENLVIIRRGDVFPAAGGKHVDHIGGKARVVPGQRARDADAIGVNRAAGRVVLGLRAVGQRHRDDGVVNLVRAQLLDSREGRNAEQRPLLTENAQRGVRAL